MQEKVININLSNVALFKNLLEIESGYLSIDLHNDYTCIKIELDNQTLSLFFQKETSRKPIAIQFNDVIINKLYLPLMNPGGMILDNFHRGRYECSGQLYEEYESKKCFYIEFYEEGQLELLCTNALLKINAS